MATERPTKGVGFNGPVSELLDRGFVTSQLMTIRRLVDRKRDVISVPRLLNEIKANKYLITREMYVCFDGLPYDYGPAYQKYFAKLEFKNGVSQMQSVPSHGPKAWSSSEQLHEHFDKLSGTNPKNRSPTDQIRTKVISDLFDRLNACSELEKAATELFAHTPDPQRGRGWGRKRFRITLNKLRRAQFAICQVVHLIDSQLLWESSSSIIPIPQFNYLEHFDKSWVTLGRHRKLYEFWDAHVEEVDGWTNLTWSLLAEPT